MLHFYRCIKASDYRHHGAGNDVYAWLTTRQAFDSSVNGTVCAWEEIAGEMRMRDVELADLLIVEEI